MKEAQIDYGLTDKIYFVSICAHSCILQFTR